MFTTTLARFRLLAALAIALILTAGCGGGGEASIASNVGSGGTGSGVVSGFGSMIVDGVRHDDNQAAYLSEAEQGSGMAVAPTAAMIGNSVEFSHDGMGNMTSVLISPELLGTVKAVAAGSVTILGTKVTANTDPAQGPVTLVVGFASFADIKVGDRAEVHGIQKTDSQGQTSVQATLIVHKTGGTGARLSGYVNQYNATAGTFAINAMTVAIGKALVTPANATIANGELVTVWADVEPAANTMAATTIRVKRPANGTLTLSGAISGYTSNSSFTVRNVSIDASKAAITPSGATLANGAYVVITGTYDGLANKLTATSVKLQAPANPSVIELHGTILNFASISSFTVRGTVVDASAATITGGTASQLANGVFVVITGTLANNVVKASKVEIVALDPQHAPSGSMVNLGGTIVSVNTANGTFTMTMNGNGATVTGQMGGSMFFDDGSAADFTPGQMVTISGMMNNGMLNASAVGYSHASPNSNPSGGNPSGGNPSGGNPSGGNPSQGAGNLHMEGWASNVTPTSFVLNGITIQRNGVTVQGRGMMSGGMLMSGSHVSVDAVLTNGQYVATSITLLGG